MVKRRRRPHRHRSNGHWETITVEEACKRLHISVGHFHRHIKYELETKKPGRQLLVNGYSIERYLRRPDAHR